MDTLKTVENVLEENYKYDKFFTLQEIWFEIRVEHDDPEICKTWQPTFNQMLNQLNLLIKQNKVCKTADGRYKLFSLASTYLDCTECGNETPWRTIDIEGKAMCSSCAIRTGHHFKT